MRRPAVIPARRFDSLLAVSVLLCACSPPPRGPAALAVPRETSAARPPEAPRCDGETFGLAPGGAEANLARVEKKRGTMGVAAGQMVAASHARATDAGLAVLREGGNAADAFIAAALVEDVVFPGVTSTAGLAGILVYEAKTRTFTYIHGGLADAIDPDRRYRRGDARIGKQVLVPGAPAAYAMLSKRFGKQPLSAMAEPAARLAESGFPIDALYAHTIAWRRGILEKSAYGASTFFHDGKPMRRGRPSASRSSARRSVPSGRIRHGSTPASGRARRRAWWVRMEGRSNRAISPRTRWRLGR